MGFLIFAYRKLSLRRKINQDQYRLTQLQSDQLQIQSNISLIQQATAASQDASQQMISNLSNAFYAGYQNSLFTSNAGLQAANDNYKKAVADAQKAGSTNPENDSKVQAAKTEMENAQKMYGNSQVGSMMAMQSFQQGVMGLNQQINSVFAAKEKGEMQALKQKDTRISQEIAHLETQLKMENQEYDNVVKAEDEEIKKSTPKFGLG